MRTMGIFDGEIVQPKFFLNLAQQLLIGFKQPHPHKSVLVFELFAYVCNCHVCHTHTLGIGGAINYSRATGDFRYNPRLENLFLHTFKLSLFAD